MNQERGGRGRKVKFEDEFEAFGKALSVSNCGSVLVEGDVTKHRIARYPKYVGEYVGKYVGKYVEEHARREVRRNSRGELVV